MEVGAFVVDSWWDRDGCWFRKWGVSLSGWPGSGLEPSNENVMESSSSAAVLRSEDPLFVAASSGIWVFGDEEASTLESDSGNRSVISRSRSGLGT